MSYYTFQASSMTRNILLNMRPSQMGKMVVLCDNNAHRIRGRFGLWDVPGWINGFIHDLWVTAKIGSLPEVKLPIIVEGESQSDRLMKTLLYEWGTARLELEFLLGDSLGNWGSFGETAIKNSNGYRYRKHRALDLITDNPGYQLQEDWQLGCKLINVGFGDLKNTDKLDFTGAWTQEFVAIQAQPPYVVNNVFGSTAAPSIPTENPILTVTINSDAIYPVSGTTINIALTKAGFNKTYTATWYKDEVITTGTVILTSDSSGSANATFDSSAFTGLGEGVYKLVVADYSATITSNELTAVMPSVSVSPASIYNSGVSTATVTVTGLEIGTTYSLGFIGLPDTSANRTQANESTSFNFSGGYFVNPGTYKARLTKGNINIDSNDLTVQAMPTVNLITEKGTIALFSENTQITASINGLQKSTALNYSWIKNNAQVGTTQEATTDANGNWTLTIGATTLQNTPYGEGSYKIRIVQGVINLYSSQIELRANLFYTQPSQNQIYYTSQQLVFDLTSIPVGASFTYQLFKSGVGLGTPTTQTFTNYSTSYPYHRITFNASNIYNSYGLSDFYSLRIVYASSTFNSNTFKLQEEPFSPG